MPVEFAGHGRRIKEPLYNDFHEAVNDAYGFILSNDAKDDEYAIWGYSMGGLLAYEICCMLARNDGKMSIHIFIASMRTPEDIDIFKRIGELNDDELLKFVVGLGGVPKEILNSSVFNHLFFPIIRNDFLLLNKYKVSEIRKFDVNMTILYGKEDYSVKKNIQMWRQYTNKNFDTIPYNGDHFFINNNSTKVFSDIYEKLLN